MGNYIKITFKDQGAGISKEHLPKIFDPYFTTRVKGHGLGLATTYSILKNHDGLITVDSVLGVGSSFLLYIPALAKKVMETEPEQSQEALFRGNGKILIMDDEDLVGEIAGEMLKSSGYEVKHARDGSEAIDVYKAAKESGKSFDLVITDLTVPGGMGGKEAIKRLRKIDPEVKAIVSSGYSDEPIMNDYEKYGFLGVLTKPYDRDQLLKIVENFV